MKKQNPEKYHYIIEMDGSCNKGTFRQLAEAGVESFVMGTGGLFYLDQDLEKACGMMLANFEEILGDL